MKWRGIKSLLKMLWVRLKHRTWNLTQLQLLISWAAPFEDHNAIIYDCEPGCAEGAGVSMQSPTHLCSRWDRWCAERSLEVDSCWPPPPRLPPLFSIRSSVSSWRFCRGRQSARGRGDDTGEDTGKNGIDSSEMRLGFLSRGRHGWQINCYYTFL